MKRQPTEWENILTNNTSDKGLISKFYNELVKLNTPPKHNPIKKWAKDPNSNFSKEEIQVANTHVK